MRGQNSRTLRMVARGQQPGFAAPAAASPGTGPPPGQLVRYAPGTEHGPRASGSPGGEPCVLLALAHEGVKLLS